MFTVSLCEPTIFYSKSKLNSKFEANYAVLLNASAKMRCITVVCCLCLGLYGNRGILPAKNVLNKGMHCRLIKYSWYISLCGCRRVL